MVEHDVDHDRDLEAVTSLAQPVRRALYDFVAGSVEPVSRDDAAEAVEVSRQVAAYHLDRLADEGLLEVEFRRLSGRSGPGAGRPSKLYQRSDQVHDVSIPPRRYELAARILLDAAREDHLDAGALTEVARRTGFEIGQAGLGAALAATGYEPVTEEGETRFRNCPFHVLRDRDRDTTCGLNLALVEGIVEGSGSDTDAVLAPEEGCCCVRLSPPVST
jgi:predicted ArsR family transcriptional regulator